MKTLVVLSALAMFAIAAPAPPNTEADVEDNPPSSSEEKNSDFREKKSADANLDTLSSSDQSSAFGSPASGRTLAIKKPIIVKKKVGYHLYRNSDEEQEHTSSRESCMDRVKVKSCKENMIHKSTMRSSTQHEPDISEEEMRHTIIMAKEAVEILQRDLKRLEDKSGVSLLQNRESDAEIHEDIEIARQALEHVHKNFGNVESMSLHDIQSTAAHTEEERLAQWKEAMDNIQKNMDIAKNIEDSFRFSSNNLFSSETDMNTATNTEELEENSDLNSMEQETRMASSIDSNNNLFMNNEVIPEKLNKISDNPDERLKEDQESDHIGSASTITEFKAKDEKTLDCMRKDVDNIESNQSSLKEKDSETTISDELWQAQFVSMPKDISKTDHASGFEEKLFKVSDNIMDSDAGASTNQMSFMKPDLMKQRNAQDEMNQEFDPSAHHDEINLSKFANNMEQFNRNTGTDNTKFDKKLTKSSDKFEKGLTNLNAKIAFPTSENKDLTTAEMTKMDKLKQDQFIENSQRSQTLMFTNRHESNGILPTFSNELKPFTTEGNMGNEAAKQAFDMRWTHNVPQHTDEINKDFFGHTRNTQFSNDPETFSQLTNSMGIPGKMLPTHGLRMSNLVSEQNHEKGWEMQPSQNINIRENSGMKPDHLFRWKPTHESSRSGFGIPASTGPLYPAPNGCSIPLLVSCAPSVVSGSLAKGHHPSYPAPSYRTDDEMGFPIKRETKKPNEITFNDKKEMLKNEKQINLKN